MRMTKVSSNTGGNVAFVALVVSLILEKNKFVSFVIGTVVAEV